MTRETAETRVKNKLTRAARQFENRSRVSCAIRHRRRQRTAAPRGRRTPPRVDDAFNGLSPLASLVRNRFFAMGSSLRKKKRAKASGTTVKVGRVKKTKQTVTVKPVLLPGAKDETTWDQDRTHQLNYEHVGIVSDPNKIGKTGRNSSKLEALEEGETEAAAAKRRREEDTSVAAQATVGGDEVRGLLGQVRSTGLAPPKRLTTKQRRIVGALVVRPERQTHPAHPTTAVSPDQSRVILLRLSSSLTKDVLAHPRTRANRLTHAYPDLRPQAKHGEDLIAMSRDRKLNAMQHTVAQLRELVVSYVAYPDLLEGGGALDFRAPMKTSLRGRNKVR